MQHGFEYGVGKTNREYWAGDRAVPTPDNQVLTFQVGIVMDDHDDQYAGRVWVYFPNMSNARSTLPNGVLPEGGANPDRASWILCYPMFPAFGSDSFRQGAEVPTGAGRDARIGQSNSYGFWFHPRIGDYVGVLFAAGDPNQGFWIGCVPKVAQNFMMPGHPGIADTTGGVTTYTPAHEKAVSDGEKPRAESAAFADSLRQSGLIFDANRGAGTASSNRESPSYVWGLKSPGWSYDAEKRQQIGGGNPATFDTDVDTYGDVNTMGHQIIMDDHPDHQATRWRSGLGAQVYMNDVEDYIYINTQTGGVWLQLDDTGRIDIYGADSISIHTEGDMNTTVDGDYNIEVLGDYNMLVHGKTYMDMRGNVSLITGYGGAGTLSVHNYGTVDITSEANWHHEILADYGLKTHNIFMGTSQVFNIAAGGNLLITGLADTSISTTGTMYLVGTGVMDISSGGNVNVQSGAQILAQATAELSLSAGATLFADGAFVVLGEAGPTPSIPTAPQAAAPPDSVPNLITTPGATYGAPTDAEIDTGKVPETVPYVAPIVPQHEPWAGHLASTKGTNNNVQYNTSLVKTIRVGATDPNAVKARNFVGTYNGQPGVWKANGYSTTEVVEAPTYTKVGDATLHSSSSLSLSDAGKAFIKKAEGFSACPYPDAGGFSVGYGHFITPGDTLGGVAVTSSTLSALRNASISGRCQILKIDTTEGDSRFDIDSQKFQNMVKKNITAQMTQGQFDAFTSLAYNCGGAAFYNSKTGQPTQVVQKFNAGDTAGAITEFMGFCKSQGAVLKVLQDRRRAEIQQLFTQGAPPDLPTNTNGG